MASSNISISLKTPVGGSYVDPHTPRASPTPANASHAVGSPLESGLRTSEKLQSEIK
jgi:hypothetical protein